MKNFQMTFFLGEEELTSVPPEFLQKVEEILPNDFKRKFIKTNIKDLVNQQSLLMIRHIDRDKHHRVWTIDPIDGTKGFAMHRDFAIGTALLNNFEVVCSATVWPTHNLKYTHLHPINNPNISDTENPFNGPLIFCSAKQCGSYAINLSLTNIVKINSLLCGKQPTNAFLFSDANNGVGILSKRYSAIKDELEVTEQIPMISMSKVFVLATGNAKVFPKDHKGSPIYAWDVAPVQLFATESGCIVTTAEGKPITYDENGIIIGSQYGVVFSAGSLEFHEKACAATFEITKCNVTYP